MTNAALSDTTDQLESLLAERILLLDGAMGTQIQALGLDERAVRGERFATHHKDLKNFADILCLTQPDAIVDIHRRYFAAGADIVETNTFGASPIGMEEFELPLELVRRDQLAPPSAWPAAPATSSTTARPTGPASSPARSGPPPSRRRSARKVDDPSYRGVTFDQMADSYYAAGGGPGRSRRRHAAARDGHRHAQPQGLPVRDRKVLRRDRRPHPGDGLRHVRPRRRRRSSPARKSRRFGTRSPTSRCSRSA